MIKKLENYMFDLLGLVLPGIIFFTLLIGLPTYIRYNYMNVKTIELDHSIELIQGFSNDYTNLFVIFSIIVLFYVIGNVIKVFSKVMYDILKVVSDNVLIKIALGIYEFLLFVLVWLLNIIPRFIVKNWNLIDFERVKSIAFERNKRNKFKKEEISNLPRFIVFLVKSLFSIYDFLALYLEKIFIFKPLDNYDFTGKNRKEVTKLFNGIYNQESDFNWYDTYKISNLLLLHDGVDTLNNKFMAKYNMYRSLSFLFGINFIYLYFLENSYFLSVSGSDFSVFYISNFIAWFAFHEKYKRYWTLAGNEALMNVYAYLLNKQTLSNGQEENNDE